MRSSLASAPAWAAWRGSAPDPAATVGAEEEVMLLDPDGWSLSQSAAAVLESFSDELAASCSPETHGSALEVQTGVNATVGGLAVELLALRRALDRVLAKLGLSAACAGTHPTALWSDTVVSDSRRYQFIYDTMRELARREPSFALHVHVGVESPEQAIVLCNRMRAHVPLLLALSANSPYWQGRDTGMCSARTPLFQAFPRVGIPRAFADYEHWVSTVELLMRSGAIPEPTFLWWDVRPQPRFGTVEVRVMDAQTTVADTAALVALVQSLARLELVEGYASATLLEATEVLDENRFLAARDGMDAQLIEPDLKRRVPARNLLEELLEACAPHADVIGCSQELEGVQSLARVGGAASQRAVARELGDDLPRLTEALARAFPAGD
jgi:glutamate---cysteine ligase / carboxylate-amine ligase